MGKVCSARNALGLVVELEAMEFRTYLQISGSA